VALYLESVPGAWLSDLGGVSTIGPDGERIVAHLERVAEARGDGDRLWAVSQLARMGRQPWRTELEDAAREGRYRWVDNADSRGIASDPHWQFEFWTSELASNCCRFVPANGVWEDVYGIDLRSVTGTGVLSTPPREWMEEYLERVGQYWLWSDAVQHYVPIAR